ncbi:hypothetical protein RFI_03862 [Reticulomyxa filosa]|uniref:Uncharacterized protein n=1 Tax=Reticulomyxa filosa TaxID=46433 RepID=X6P3W7_RETFI|nr:hypothetical protein RFI_03862 [Reticulomyxa filosa]|eukprot:ETO33245.1 hypothetical protein RFI_03862 [Reticulomyxa filosa]
MIVHVHSNATYTEENECHQQKQDEEQSQCDSPNSTNPPVVVVVSEDFSCFDLCCRCRWNEQTCTHAVHEHNHTAAAAKKMTMITDDPSSFLIKPLSSRFCGKWNEQHLQSMKRMCVLGLTILILFVARALVLLFIALNYNTYTAYVSTYVVYHLIFEYFPLIVMMIMYRRGVVHLLKKWQSN